MDIFWKIFVSVLATLVISAIMWGVHKVDKIIKTANSAIKKENDELLNTRIIKLIDDRVEPLREELTEIHDEIQEQLECSEDIENSIKDLKENFMAAYRYRLVRLCKMYLAQGCMIQDQYDQLSELYRLYRYLGGNGQGEKYYNKAMDLPVVADSQLRATVAKHKGIDTKDVELFVEEEQGF